MNACVCECVCTLACVCMCECMGVCECVCAHVCVHVCVCMRVQISGGRSFTAAGAANAHTLKPAELRVLTGAGTKGGRVAVDEVIGYWRARDAAPNTPLRGRRFCAVGGEKPEKGCRGEGEILQQRL